MSVTVCFHYNTDLLVVMSLPAFNFNSKKVHNYFWPTRYITIFSGVFKDYKYVKSTKS